MLLLLLLKDLTCGHDLSIGAVVVVGLSVAFWGLLCVD
jgi:hypothetical protein